MYTGCLPHPQAGSAGSIANNRLAGPLFPVQTGHHNRECMTLHEQESPAHVPWHWRGIMHKRGTDASTQRSSLLPWLACAIQRFARQRGSVLELGVGVGVLYSNTTFIRETTPLLQIRQVAHLVEHYMQPARMKLHAQELGHPPASTLGMMRIEEG